MSLSGPIVSLRVMATDLLLAPDPPPHPSAVDHRTVARLPRR